MPIRSFELLSLLSGTAAKRARGLVYALRAVGDIAHRRLRGEATAPDGECLLAALFPLAGNRAARVGIPSFGPVSQRVAVPRRLWLERGKPEPLPQRTRALHVLARRQRERRHRMLEGGVD